MIAKDLLVTGDAKVLGELTTKDGAVSIQGHIHDDRYYTEDEIDASLDDLQTTIEAELDKKLPNTTAYAASSSVGGAATSANKVNKSLKIQLNSGTSTEFDGSAEKIVNITPGAINAYTKGEIDAEITKIEAEVAKKSDTGHTHNYAGSSSAGGAADSVKSSLTFNNSGSGAASGTTFNGSEAKTISYNTVGAAAASHTHDDRYYTESEVDSKIATAMSSVDLSNYYTKANVDSALSGKSNTSHGHSTDDIKNGTLSTDRLPTIPVGKGGTNATTATGAIANLGMASAMVVVSFDNGTLVTETLLGNAYFKPYGNIIGGNISKPLIFEKNMTWDQFISTSYNNFYGKTFSADSSGYLTFGGDYVHTQQFTASKILTSTTIGNQTYYSVYAPW